MYCSKCGTLIPDGAKFCKICGTQVMMMTQNAAGMDRYADSKTGNAIQDKGESRKKKSSIAAVAIAVILVFCIGMFGYVGLRQFSLRSDNPDELSQKAAESVITGDSPEEIVEIFMDAFAKQDIDTMLACCYSDEMVERYSFAGVTEYLHSYVPNMMFSEDSQFYKELALYEQKGVFARNIRHFTWSILLAEDEEDGDILEGMPKANVDYDWALEFESKVDSEKIYGFEVLRIDENNPEVQHRDQIIDNNQRRSEVYGVDDICERTVLFECNGMLFYKGFTLVQYDGQWQIQSLSAGILGESSNGNASRIESVDAYMEMIE